MRRTAILALAMLLLAGGWPGSAAAQEQQNQRARPASRGTVDDLRTELATVKRELAALTRQMAEVVQRLQELQDSVGALRARLDDTRGAAGAR